MSLTLSLIAGGLVGGPIARLLPRGGDAAARILPGVAGAAVGAWPAGLLGVRVLTRLDMLASGIVGAAVPVPAVRAARR